MNGSLRTCTSMSARCAAADGGGTSFRQILDEVRHGRALELLGQGAAVAEVARELGYSETATFTRAFTRWEGVPPSRAGEGVRKVAGAHTRAEP